VEVKQEKAEDEEKDDLPDEIARRVVELLKAEQVPTGATSS
jgi:hypothetical protein